MLRLSVPIIWVIKVNEKPDITSICRALYLSNKVSIRKPLVDKYSIVFLSGQCFLQKKI